MPDVGSLTIASKVTDELMLMTVLLKLKIVEY